ncbi:hypothetical protein POUND7_007309 [Theobroma cacao]
MFSPRLVFASIFIAICLSIFALGATPPNGEVEALKSIVETLGKRDWNFDVPCSQDNNWEEKVGSSPFYANNVTCDCSFSNNTTCHVVSILFKSQNLSGTLPTELAMLPFLKEIDLTRNYLNGAIPPQWGSMQLTHISLLGNRLTGSIPEELASLSNLTSLVLEHNNFAGNLPPALGNLPKIERMFLNSNNFTGELPSTFARLTALTDFRIGDNNFTGKIPDFIQNWVQLKTLYIQASGLSGPIPSAIGALQNLTKLVISDLNGAEGPLPPLDNFTKLEILVLRSCKLIGDLPNSLRELTALKKLDLSFNRLSGVIPPTLDVLGNRLKHLYLTGNVFAGPIPDWILERQKPVDVSYNNFTSTSDANCGNGEILNLFASISRGKNSGIVSCLGITQCQQTSHFLHINCGGKQIPVSNTTYEGDSTEASPLRFFKGGNNWAFSSTGYFEDDAEQPNQQNDKLIIENTQLSMRDHELYTTARLSPISLTYYAFCLVNGTYNVSLHFAEIRFTGGQNFSSLGRRIFDVYIQVF